jgi:hypothetical protein
MNEPDDLRRGLDDLAGSIDVGDLDLQAVHSSARRRRLRVRLGASLGVAALAVGATVAVVAFNADDEPDTLATADVEEQDDSDVAPTTVDETPPSTELSTTPALSVEVVERAVTVGQRVGVGGAPQFGEWTVGWQDGFLVGAQSFTPQPLPDELPEEVVALFPQEVLDVFGGELPATISEATQMLSEAGLLETVTDIIADNPAASEAIYSVETEVTPPTLDVRFTTDGVTWEPVEMTLPPDASYFNGVATVDGRLVVSYGLQDPTTGASADGIARVASTENLVDWTVQEIVVAPPPVELPTGALWSVYLSGVTANEAGWVASVYAGVEFDPVRLLPDEVRAEYEQSEDGYSSSLDDTGISLERFVGGQTETDKYTWDELGISPDVAAYLTGQNYEPTMWTATWDGMPTASPTPGPTQQIVATPAGFVGLDDRIWFSADGLTWAASPLPVEDDYVSSSFTFDGGIIAFVNTRDGVRILRLDERGGSPEWLDIPGLPESPQSAFGVGSRLGVVMDAAEPGPPPPPLVVEADGHRLTIDNATGIVEVVELATDEIVATADFMRGLDDDGPIVFDRDGVTVTDPVTGVEVVVFPADELEAASMARYETEPPSEMEEYRPDMWLLATLDGETFVLDDLDDGTGDSYYGPGTLAANGSRLLLQAAGNWVVYDLA